ncbi:hypothetical protein F4814DRAFT_457575 [Daldinia grandis]|nr:hypothetical protein F4814DRAFT_457575 [Daldinia grandis]
MEISNEPINPNGPKAETPLADNNTTSDDNPDSVSINPIPNDLEQQFEDVIRKGDCIELERLLGSKKELIEKELQYEFKERGSNTVRITLLALAAALSKPAIVKFLLENNANVKAADSKFGETALHMAARRGPVDTVDLLLSHGADVNQKGLYDATPLHLACKYGQLEIVARLLDAHADLTAHDKNGTAPFLTACMSNKREVMEFLLDRGPKEQLNEKNKFSNGPLHLASLNNSHDAVEWLLKYGVPTDPPGDIKHTPLHFACEIGNTEIIKTLISYGADIHKRSKRDSSPILHSCFYAQLRSFETLMTYGASVFDVNGQRNTCFHNVVLGTNEFSDSHKHILEALVGAGLNINQPNRAGYSPLWMACAKQKDKHVRCLLDLGADINYKLTSNGSTALMEACCKSDTQTVKTLLQLGPDMAITNNDGLTALALACRFGKLENVKLLIANGATVAIRDKDGHTPLYTAVMCGHIDIALEILATPVYFPQSVVQEKAFEERTISMEHVHEIEDKLLKSFDDTKYQEQESLERILHWAIVNGAFTLAHRCISQNPDVLQWKRNGKTWLHVAALHEQHGFIQLLEKTPAHKVDVFATAEDSITALHLATIGGHVKTVQSLLQMMPKQSDRVEAIIKLNSQSESPLTISITRRHKNLEDIFWDVISELGTADKSFMQRDPGKASKILELVAIYETPGNEVVLHQLLQQWYPNKQIEDRQDFTTLHLAVSCSQAVVVWWLLSKGGYSDYIESALKLLPGEDEDDSVENYIKGLLLHPPPILAQVANPNNDRITLPPTLANEENCSLKMQGNIVDIYSKGGRVSIPYTKSSINNIVYEEGPECLMAKARKNLNLDALKRKLERTIHDEDKWGVDSPLDNRGAQHSFDINERSFGGVAGDLKLRWIHLPVNDLQIMRDLVCRLSHDAKRLAMDHTALMTHFNNSWTELAAGGKRNYMKPQCVRKEIDHSDHPNDNQDGNQLLRENNSCTALYMPYLTLGTYPRVDSDCSTDRADRLEESISNYNSRQINHKSMTLDQYYYPTIANSDERDNDQVLSKFLDEKDGLGRKKIFLVNQLWIWIIDEKTIISATTEDSGHTKNLFQNIQNNILYGETRSRFERATSVQSIMELFVGAASGFFMEKFISCPGQDMGQRINKGPIEIFRESIRKVADDETRLFRDFLQGLRNEARGRGGPAGKESQSDSRAQQISQNRYHVISPETELLEIIRDIRDELHILRSLAEDQDVVWKQAFASGDHTDHPGQFQYYHSCTPTDVKKSLDDMLLEAEKTTDYINDLLDLRQAEYNREQANDSANQSKSIFIFTVVTIVFLPLSFLSSLFALDVTSFPHESGSLKYEARWLFPILFGVTAAVSIPAIFLAWNVNAISELFQLRAKKDSAERPATTNASDAPAQKSVARISGERLRRRWRRRDKNVLPQHEGP